MTAAPAVSDRKARGSERLPRKHVSGSVFALNCHFYCLGISSAMRRSDEKSRTLDEAVSVRSAARLRAFRRDVELAFPEMIENVLLFGSRARGEAGGDSDYDVAVLFKGAKRPADVRAVLSDAAYRHMLAGVHIRPLAVLSEYVCKDGALPVCRNIARDGIAIR
jgi:predicted nucleotidyltransferase